LGHLAHGRQSWYQFDIMSTMPNVHIRDVPSEAVETLRDAARRHGRSLNAEIVAVLVERAQQEEDRRTLAQRLKEAQREWRMMNPDGFPPGLEPETIIRAARDAH
jgi:plasmid stability protein